MSRAGFAPESLAAVSKTSRSALDCNVHRGNSSASVQSHLLRLVFDTAAHRSPGDPLHSRRIRAATDKLAFASDLGTSCEMALPSKPVTLTVEQLTELNRKLTTLRHDINNNLSLIVAATELIKHKPQVTERMMSTLAEQPNKITEALRKFSLEFEQALGITRS